MRYCVSWKTYRLLQERQPEIGGVLSGQQMLAFLLLKRKEIISDLVAVAVCMAVCFINKIIQNDNNILRECVCLHKYRFDR